MIQRGAHIAAADAAKVINQMLADLGFAQVDGYAWAFSQFGVEYRSYRFGLYKGKEEEGDNTGLRDIVPLADQLLRMHDVFEEALKSGHQVVVWRKTPEVTNLTMPGKTHVVQLKCRLHFMTLGDYKTATQNKHTLKAYRDLQLKSTNNFKPDIVFKLDHYEDYNDPTNLPDPPKVQSNFPWAMKMLESGKKVHRDSWPHELYVELRDNQLWIDAPHLIQEFKPNLESLQATDWQVYEMVMIEQPKIAAGEPGPVVNELLDKVKELENMVDEEDADQDV